MRLAEIVEPKSWIVFAGVVLHQRELSPAHGTAVPSLGRVVGACRMRQDRGSQCQAGGLDKIATRRHDFEVLTMMTHRAPSPSRLGTGRSMREAAGWIKFHAAVQGRPSAPQSAWRRFARSRYREIRVSYRCAS